MGFFHISREEKGRFWLYSPETFNVKNFFWDESGSLLVYASWYILNMCTLRLAYARYEKPLKYHFLDGAKKSVETYLSSNTAAQYLEERVN